MVNKIWFFFIVMGILVAAVKGEIGLVTNTLLNSAEKGVTVAFGLISILTFWLGIMKLIEKSGLINIFTKLLKPFVKFLFPDVPSSHPAMSSILMNISANLLGMGSAATPLGLKAMEQLQQLNKDKETASNAMCTFLAINTSSLTIIPTTVIALRMATGSTEPTRIVGTTIIATFCSSFVAIALDRFFRKLYRRH
ncbi:spore maturation protein A [Anaerobranca californiensis DSM 14826]|jgi:spore maturation protein A|uniref:Spore maturation protein A n=1 Tax=Anaerobranca californiensis DSM 14826 TaxID=1120989 RepID=A0A1M6L0W4_9FIRM|nr:nucleoside recognition domain-containing protein [Anaerobranca californiensis]SHJ64860.1 spore maturation protein A [Anaerobranca californiensis DSM 14826]